MINYASIVYEIKMNNLAIKNFSIIFILLISPNFLSQSVNHTKFYPAVDSTISYHDYFSNYIPKTNSLFIRMDSIVTQSIQGQGSKLLFQYYDNNKIKEWLNLFNDGSGWYNSSKRERYYDEQNNLITQINLDWNIDHWDSSSRINYSYEEGMLYQSVFQVYDNNYWENRTRKNYEYDQNQNLSITLSERWINNNWQNDLLVTNFYSLENRRDSILFQTWENNNWQNFTKTAFYYSENQIDVDSIIAKTWDGISWMNFLKQEIVNDANHNQIEQLEKFWDFGGWVNFQRRFFDYNEYNMIEIIYCEIWENNQWIRGNGDIIFQNPDGFTVGFITSYLSAYYSNVVSIDENYNRGVRDYTLFQNYPNPFNPSTQIEYRIPHSTFVEIKVYDVLGKEITTLVDEFKTAGIYKVQFNTRNLSSGVYFYTIKAGEYSETKKMLLLR